MIVIQLSDLNIHERLIPYLTNAMTKLEDFINKLNEDFVIVFVGNIFATKTYLSAEDINFFNDTLDLLSRYKVLFSMGINDYNIHARDAKVAYSHFLESRGIPFLNSHGVYEFYGVRWAFIMDQSMLPDADYGIFFEPPKCNFSWKGAMYSGGKQFCGARIGCAGQLVQNNPEDGHTFGVIIWNEDKLRFLPLHQTWPSVKISIKDNTKPVLGSFHTNLMIVQYHNCDTEFVLLMSDIIRGEYKCPVEIITDKDTSKDAIPDPHDKNYHLEIIRERFPAHPLLNSALNSYQEKVQPVAYNLPKWRIDYLIWDNLFSYKEGNFINFHEMDRMTFIAGKNKSGKSSIIDIITLALFNRPVRCKITEVINNSFNRTAYLKCGITIDSKSYTIERTFDRIPGKAAIAQKFLFCLIKDDGESIDLEGRNVAEMYAMLYKLLPLNYNSFRLNIAIQEERSFLNLSIHEKKQLIHVLLRMEYLQEVARETAASKKELKRQLSAIKEISNKKASNKTMVDVEADLQKYQGESTSDAKQLTLFPGNLHIKTSFLANFDKFVDAVSRRHQLIIDGVKPIMPLSESKMLQKKIETISLFEDALGMSGVLGHIFQKFANKCELLINKMLSRISDFSISLEVCAEGFAFYIIDNQKKIAAASASGYQKFLFDLITRIVFLHVSRLTNFPIIIVDEGFGCLDEDNFIKVSKAINMLKSVISIVIITHVEELKTYADKIITVSDHRVAFLHLSNNQLERGDLHEERKIKKSSNMG